MRFFIVCQIQVYIAFLVVSIASGYGAFIVAIDHLLFHWYFYLSPGQGMAQPKLKRGAGKRRVKIKHCKTATAAAALTKSICTDYLLAYTV